MSCEFILSAQSLGELSLDRDNGYIVRPGVSKRQASWRSVARDRPGANGEINTTRLRGRTSITLSLLMTAEHGDTFQQRLDTLRRYTRPGIGATLSARWSDGDEPRVAELTEVVADGSAERPTHEPIVFQAVIPSGVWLGDVRHMKVITPGVVETGGVEFDGVEFDGVEFPLVEPPGVEPVNNRGTTDAVPLLRAFGPFGLEGNPGDHTTFANLTTGKELVIEGTGIVAGDYLELDFKARTIRVNGLSTQSRRDRLVFPDSEWWTLVPGVNEIAFRPDTFSGNCQLHIFWSDTYA